eukprot:10018540-Alexandrium_andersonii.AAC.1
MATEARPMSMLFLGDFACSLVSETACPSAWCASRTAGRFQQFEGQRRTRADMRRIRAQMGLGR